MFAHVLDHCFFSTKRFSEKTKNIIFGVNVFLQLAMFYWFKELAWGIEGPVSDYKHRGWRSVSPFTLYLTPPRITDERKPPIPQKSWNLY